MINFDQFYNEIETILSPLNQELAKEFKRQTLAKGPKDVYLWCGANLKLIGNDRLSEILKDFYYSVR